MTDRFKLKYGMPNGPNVKANKVRWITSEGNSVTLGYEDDEMNREVQFNMPISLFELLYYPD